MNQSIVPVSSLQRCSQQANVFLELFILRLWTSCLMLSLQDVDDLKKLGIEHMQRVWEMPGGCLGSNAKRVRFWILVAFYNTSASFLTLAHGGTTIISRLDECRQLWRGPQGPGT
jgi:hypothetical protein